MTVEGSAIPPREKNKRRWVEPIAALVMALATVGTAWSSYESASWTRRSNRLLNEFNALERKANLLSIQGMQMASIHAALFMQVVAAHDAGNEKLVDTYVQRFPPDLRKAYDAWMKQEPFTNAKADPHPLVPNLYEMRGATEAAEATATGAAKVQEARTCGNVSGQYLANTVLFAAVLFFANASSKFDQRRVRIVSFLFAVGVFLFAVARIIILPH